MKQKECQYIKSDSTKCTSFAMNGSDFCYRHNPDIPQEEKINASSKGGQANEQYIETPLPAIKIEKMTDVVTVLADSINQVRAGKISQKTGGTLAYMSFILLMAMDKAKSEAKQENIEKLKAEGKWRPEPKYAPKFYTYKDDFFLDKDGNHLFVEKDGSTFRPVLEFKREEVECKHQNHKRKKRHYKNHSHFNEPDNDTVEKTNELIQSLKENMEINNDVEVNSS
ncbi:MAG: hypothetical protein ACHQJ4_00600 [Ignavibacteria bacterium]